MGSMHTGLEEKRGLYELAAFYTRRARGGVGLIITGGISPNKAGWLLPFAARLTHKRHLAQHINLTDAVHLNGSKICLQILHAGRYAYHPFSVAPSAIKAPINPFTPWKMTKRCIKATILDFAKCAQLAKMAGYDGVEIMGSEGYLINQFIAPRTNQRTDEWGGSYTNRIKFPLQIVREIRELCGPKFIIIFRLSLLDLVKDGSNWDEIIILGNALAEAGASILNTGIGWHESRVPTIATGVPRGAFSWVTAKLKQDVTLPVIAANRVNSPQDAEKIIEMGYADMVSMARPLLADPDWVLKAKHSMGQAINTCIACNQACLDYVFQNKPATCMVNPYACNETKLVIHPASKLKQVAVVGAGPAGLAAACNLAKLGHKVTLFEKNMTIGGQFNLAKTIPGKAEFQSNIDYFAYELDKNKVTLCLGHEVVVPELTQNDFAAVVIATGIKPRDPKIPGANYPRVVSYIDALTKPEILGNKIVILGAGGIGVDVATFLVSCNDVSVEQFFSEWGVDLSLTNRGGLTTPQAIKPKRHVTIIQRKSSKIGSNLGKTTGWIHRQVLQKHNVATIAGATYTKFLDNNLFYTQNGLECRIEADNFILCCGQNSNQELLSGLIKAEIPYYLIGGAANARQLDAVRAIREGTLVAQKI